MELRESFATNLALEFTHEPSTVIVVKIVVPFRSSSNESKNYYCGKRRMKIHTEKNKPR